MFDKVTTFFSIKKVESTKTFHFFLFNLIFIARVCA